MQSSTFTAWQTGELNTKLTQQITKDFIPGLAIVFCDKSHDLEKICSIFNRCNIQMIGCTTAGEICNDELLSGSITVMLFDLPRNYFCINFQDVSTDQFEPARKMGAFAVHTFENPGMILLSGGLTRDADQMMAGLKAGLKKEIPLYGGLAGDGAEMNKTCVFTNNGNVVENGLAAIIFDCEYIELEGLAVSGWKPMGKEYKITKAEGNVVYEINNKPAMDVFVDVFGQFDNTIVSGQPVKSLTAQYPLQINREDGLSVLRVPMVGNKDDGSMILAGGVKSGDTFRFSLSPGFEVVDQTVESFQNYGKEVKETDAMILFSCIGRHMVFGPMMENEIIGIHDQWQKPLAGFLTYGEIGHKENGVCEFHNVTCSLVLIREK